MTSHETLTSAADRRYGSKCPCCGKGMLTRWKGSKKGKPTPDLLRTIGHVTAIARDGDPDLWVHICWRCNNDQGDLPFSVWARKLKIAGDPREPAVLELDIFVRRYLDETCRVRSAA